VTTTSASAQAGPGQAAEDRPQDRTALTAGFGAYFLWGGLSILFMALARQEVQPWEILAHRCLWSLPWAALFVGMARAQGEVWAVLRTPRTMLWLTASAFLVSLNWAIFIFASTTGHKLDASLAYYINPLLNMAAGGLLFGERFTRAGAVAIALACIGVLLQGLAVGHPPWLALSMAVTFWGYGVIRKHVPVSAQAGLFIETLKLAPLGLAYVAWLAVTGQGHFGAGVWTTALILAAGPATAVPLALFAFAARKVPLSTMGFLQFIMPTALFAIAMATGEPMTPLRALSFAFIWGGVAVFSLGSWRRSAAGSHAPSPLQRQA
jgi:chloramphenicol-sensitive protein RarD